MEEREEGNLLVGTGNWGNLLVRGAGGGGTENNEVSS